MLIHLNFKEIKEIVSKSNEIVFFGGAGTSTESGIPDFRTENGLFNFNNENKYSPEEILSYDFFVEHTAHFFDFYKSNMIHKDALPNSAHYALVSLEKKGQLKAIITQNIDGLHQKAGSQNVIELHGSVDQNYCMKCKIYYSLDFILQTSDPVPLCKQCGGIIKPDVVLYQEMLDEKTTKKAMNYIRNAEILIVAGTSLTVYPAAGMIRNYLGDKLILINKSSTRFDSLANYIIPESIGLVLSNLVKD